MKYTFYVSYETKLYTVPCGTLNSDTYLSTYSAYHEPFVDNKIANKQPIKAIALI